MDRSPKNRLLDYSESERVFMLQYRKIIREKQAENER